MRAYCYILECAEGSFYCGWTYDLEKRLAMHQAGKGARYTRSHLPVKLVYSEECADRAAAMKREKAIKSMTRARKLGLVREFNP